MGLSDTDGMIGTLPDCTVTVHGIRMAMGGWNPMN